MTNDETQSYAPQKSKRKARRLRQQCCLTLLSSASVAKAMASVVVDHAGRLHEGVADGCSHESKTTAFEVFAHRIRFACARGHAPGPDPIVFLRLPANKLPNIAVEGAELFLYREECSRVRNC